MIFKTHLDLGFTDFARNVAAAYFEQYIPHALRVAEELRRAGGAERFVWTTGSWLIYDYLERASHAERAVMEQAIVRGDVVWHGLPFTLHSELMDVALFRFGLGLSQELDARFGKQTIAAKMTDVPGHTRGIVSLLANAGIRFLHIGVNPASTPPAVPPLFVWRAPDGSEVIAASTMDAFARKLLKLKTYLPIVTQELGDTWIHGAASDPKKLSRFRKLLALRRLWLERRSVDPESGESKKFSRALLLVLEHTWGLDVKTHLADYENYRSDLFNAARVQPNFQKMETSWQEQRDYVTQAVDGLGDSPLAKDSPML